MASYAVPADARTLPSKQLEAGQVDTVTFADDLDEIEVFSDGASDLFVRCDGHPAVVADFDCDILPGGIVQAAEITIPTSGVPTVVSLVATGTVVYSLTALKRPDPRFRS